MAGDQKRLCGRGPNQSQRLFPGQPQAVRIKQNRYQTSAGAEFLQLLQVARDLKRPSELQRQGVESQAFDRGHSQGDYHSVRHKENPAARKGPAWARHSRVTLKLKTRCMTALRHDWTLREIESIYTAPLPDLIFRAQTVHRAHHRADEVQGCMLLSIKTGGCPEDCAYCPQSARYDTGVDRQDLLSVDETLAAARDAREQGATRFCMGAAWRDIPKDRPILLQGSGNGSGRARPGNGSLLHTRDANSGPGSRPRFRRPYGIQSQSGYRA